MSVRERGEREREREDDEQHNLNNGFVIIQIATKRAYVELSFDDGTRKQSRLSICQSR